jgi:hypothetical protein
MSKDTAQVLNRGDSVKVYFANDPNSPYTLESKTEAIINGHTLANDITKIVPLCINSNYVCQSAVDTIDNLPEDFKLKLSKETTLTAELNTGVEGATKPTYTIPLNNYINGNTYYTKVSFDEELTSIKLNCNIPSNTFGLVMVYYIPTENNYNVEVCPTITLKTTGDDADEPSQVIELINPDTNEAYTTAELVKLGHYPNHVLFTHYGIRPFNNIDYLDGYRPGQVGTGDDKVEYNYSLQPGINILEVSPRVTELTFKTTTPSTNLDTIIIGNLDIVKGINLKLDYRITNTANTNTLEQLKADLRDIIPAQSFYYNIPTQDTSNIDLNPYIEEDKLSSPLT